MTSGPRTGCPVHGALELLGDRWTLLIVRDLLVRGYTRFQQFEDSGEGIAPTVLAERLRRLRRAGVVSVEPDGGDGRRRCYRLTAKGVDLAPVVFELLVWGAKYEAPAAARTPMLRLASQREALLKEVRRRWRKRDTRPLLPAGVWKIENQGERPCM